MTKIYKKSFLYSFIATIYIGLVAIFINNANKIFGQMDTAVSATAFLLLFSLSTLIVGTLLVGKPIMLYIDGKKKDAVLMLFATSGWLLLFLLIALLIMTLTK